MKTIVKARRAFVALCLACLLAPTTLWARGPVDDSPNPYAMAGDLVVARPIGIVLTAAGTAAWVVSLPFTLLAGHAGEAAETLVVGPGKNTFVRCLGCRSPGYTGKDIARNRAQAEARD